ncbi:Hypothetical protein LUCI_2445 [Lucifera butyrica]|uniref:Uncharacterized protein n=1 Tax=Lucifera butyrica TaxID=1351585 RepID=A0A498R757_9FIRM|nr:hypothetical protein [Lucifera butyrica]VBB07201.1 Hypothetical protein LUCI_2445 [Lucifera butyrica]
MKKKVVTIALVGLFLIALTGSVFAWPSELNGRPEAFHPGQVIGYFIWHDGSGIHIRTTTKGQSHIFSGAVHTNGRFVDVHGVRLENVDAYTVGHERHQMDFRFETAGGVDGIDFKVDGGEKVVFDLFIDGHKISPDVIYGGAGSWHPDHSRFEIIR